MEEDQDNIEQPSAEEVAAQRAAERDALEKVFYDIRVQSSQSELVTPDRWAEEDFIPAHLDSQQFVDLVFGYLAEAAEAADAAEAAEAAEVEPSDGDAIADDAPSAAVDEDEETASEGQTEGEGSIPAAIPCADIAFLEGAETMYLYSRDHMTDAYANWAFLAREDDKVATLVQCAREESRVYPRPMISGSLKNAPFRMSDDEILDAWQTVRESGAYPDIASCTASNDDLYFYSTDYLSDVQAKALAEWYSVEQGMNV